MSTEENDIYDFGLRLSKLRKINNLSQSDLAKKLNLHRNTIGGYESNSLTPSVEVLKDIAILLKTSTDYLLGLENRNPIYLNDFTEDQEKTVFSLIDDLRKNFLDK